VNAISTVVKMDGMEYKSALAAQKREMQIMLIREKHPVYVSFNFSRYSDHKIAEMYKVLVEDFQQGTKDTEVQTKV
jgi:hypothetical protein